MLNDRSSINQGNEPVPEGPTLADICSGDAEFDFVAVGLLYIAAQEAVVTDSDQHVLEEQRNHILDMLTSYLSCCSEEIARALGDGDISPSQAQRGARIIAQMYEQYGEIKNWPEEFSGLLSSYRDVAHQGIEALNRKVVENGEGLREEFALAVQSHWTHLDCLRQETDPVKRTEGAQELSQAISIYFHGAVDIEAVCAWRLGKTIRSQFRKIGRFLETEFSVSTVLPEVPMDPTRSITAGNKIPRIWSE